MKVHLPASPSLASVHRLEDLQRSRLSFPPCLPRLTRAWLCPGAASGPDYKSMLTDLIQRYTRMQVFEVEDGMVVRPNCTYIIPPNRDIACLNGALQLLDPSSPRVSGCPSIFSFDRSPRTSTIAPSASCSRAPAETVPWACGRSRAIRGGDGHGPDACSRRA